MFVQELFDGCRDAPGQSDLDEDHRLIWHSRMKERVQQTIGPEAVAQIVP